MVYAEIDLKAIQNFLNIFLLFFNFFVSFASSKKNASKYFTYRYNYKCMLLYEIASVNSVHLNVIKKKSINSWLKYVGIWQSDFDNKIIKWERYMKGHNTSPICRNCQNYY